MLSKFKSHKFKFPHQIDEKLHMKLIIFIVLIFSSTTYALSDSVKNELASAKSQIDECKALGKVECEKKYSKITPDEIMDSGISADNLGNLNQLLLDTSDILTQVQEDSDSFKLRLIAGYLKWKGCIKYRDEMEKLILAPVSYELISHDSKPLSLKQLDIFTDQREVHYFVINEMVEPIIVKVVKQANSKKVEVSYYKRIEDSFTSKEEQPEVINGEIKFDEYNSLNYDVLTMSMGYTISDNGNQITLKSSAVDENVGAAIKVDNQELSATLSEDSYLLASKLTSGDTTLNFNKSDEDYLVGTELKDGDQSVMFSKTKDNYLVGTKLKYEQTTFTASKDAENYKVAAGYADSSYSLNVITTASDVTLTETFKFEDDWNLGHKHTFGTVEENKNNSSHEFSIDTGNKKVLGVIYQRESLDSDYTNEKLKVNSEIYKNEKNSARVFVEHSCEEDLTHRCISSFQFSFKY